MKKTLKRNLITVACLACACIVSAGGMAIKAQAETLTVTDNFYMTDGAAIRIKGGKTPSGIRWKVNVTEEYYNQITEDGAKEVSFGTLVDDTAIVSMEQNATEVNIPCTAKPNFVEGVWSYYASITYDELAETLAGEGYNYTPEQISQTLALVYKETLYARGYAVVDGEYIYAETADVARSIKDIAMNCLIEENTTGNDDVTVENKADFEAYAGGAYNAITNDGVTKNAYNVNTATGKVTSQNDLKAGTYSVYVGAKNFGDVTLATDGKATATIAGLGAAACVTGEVNNVRFVGQEGEVYQVPFVSATHTISTLEELKAYMDSNGSTDETAIAEEKTWYAVLTQDITFTTRWDAGKANSVAFRGVFDGLGYMITGPIYGWNSGGVFGDIKAGAIVKNVGFDGLYSANAPANALCGFLRGTMENVYVKASTANTAQYVRCYSGTIKNCVFDVDFTGATVGKTVWNRWGASSNIFSIGSVNASVNSDGSANDITTNYATAADFLAEQGENACWNGYWTLSDLGLCFGDTLVAQYASETKAMAYGAAYTYANNAYTKQDTFTVDASALIGEATDYTVLLDGEEIETNGVLTLNVADYTLGSTHEVTVAANGKIYNQPFMVVSHAISTLEELKAYMNSNGSTDETAIAEEKTWYAVLTQDITFTTRWDAGKANSVAFRGVFDGLGHMITGPIYAWNSGGLFGAIQAGAIVKNVGFDGLYSANAPANALSGYMSGTLENVYVKASTTTTAQYVRLMQGTIKNCIFDVTFTGSTLGKTLWNNWGTKTNVFSIGAVNTTDATYPDITTNYATAADFISAQLANVTEANGWNMNVWSVKEGKLYFGTALVG